MSIEVFSLFEPVYRCWGKERGNFVQNLFKINTQSHRHIRLFGIRIRNFDVLDVSSLSTESWSAHPTSQPLQVPPRQSSPKSRRRTAASKARWMRNVKFDLALYFITIIYIPAGLGQVHHQVGLRVPQRGRWSSLCSCLELGWWLFRVRLRRATHTISGI